MIEYNVAFNTGYIKEGDYHTKSGFALAKELFEEDITAIFSCNDLMAYSIYHEQAFAAENTRRFIGGG